MPQSKILELPVAGASKLKVPPVLLTLRQHIKAPLLGLLEGLFNNSDDALFEMADRSHSAADQDMFFESMRELRLFREQISSDYVNAFYSGFDDLMKPEQTDVDFTDDVEMLPDDELEISVAISGMISKITNQHSMSITQLTKRIDHVSTKKGGPSITDRTNPLGPDRLSQVFVSAISCLGVEIKVRIVLLKLYERFVLERLEDVYDVANDFLIEAKVLPDLKKFVRKGRTAGVAESLRSRPEATASQAQAPVAGGSFGDFGDIQRLLAATRPMGATLPTGGPSIPTPQLLSVLSTLQEDATEQPLDMDHAPQMIDLRQLVATRLPGSAGDGQSNMQQADDDAVNFVGLLFDYILNDRNLAIPMKHLIARLQIPIVKLSIMDKSFFVKTSHPARQLLNELSSAGIGWSGSHELKRDALYNKIESIVLRVLNGFSDNPQIFPELVEELREYVNTDHKRSSIVEKRVKKSEEGKAKTTKARQIVQKIINQKAAGLKLPPEIGRFVSETWSKVLVYLCVKNGTESEPWNAGLKSLDDLLWCIQPLSTREDLELRDRIAVELVQRLDRGMNQVAIANHERAAHLQNVQKLLDQVTQTDRAFFEADEIPVLNDTFEELEEIVLAPVGPQDESVEPEPEFLEQINALSEGVWVELEKSPDERFRCKLATIVQPGDLYIFVNRRGMKVAERTRSGLAVDLKRGALTVLQESQVFDRALQAVIGNLRKMHREPAKA